MKKLLSAFALLFLAAGCGSSINESKNPIQNGDDTLYSSQAQEHKVRFQALYKSEWSTLQNVPSRGQVEMQIKSLIPFLFGPLTYREIGAPQRDDKVSASLEQAFERDGVIWIPYVYEGTWLIEKGSLQKQIQLPVPFNIGKLKTKRWLACTDSDPEHQTWSFFWYFWDPSRAGCDHQLDREFQNVAISVGQQTAQTVRSYPEYARMIRNDEGRQVLSMTFAFGYVEEKSNPNPDRDGDAGAREFQKFQSAVRNALSSRNFREEPITATEYGAWTGQRVGTRFVGALNGIEYRVSVVAAAGVDQMDIFAKSYATDHEGFFGWFGHSRVGAGFDAMRFQSMVETYPGNYSVSNAYQLVYWAGCNSYSYYTLPFFEMKARRNLAADPNGTKNLDLISNGLPSLFAFNANNAMVLFNVLMNLSRPASYQEIVDRLEDNGRGWGIPILVNVLGDEDNQ